MDQAYHINTGPMGAAREEESSVTVYRGKTRFEITVKYARIKDTDFGKDLMRQVELCLGWGCSGECGSLNHPIDLIYLHCLPFIEALAPQTSVHGLDLESFLHLPTYKLELVAAGNEKDTRIEGESMCFHEPAFYMSPMRTAELPESCKSITHFEASKIWIMPSSTKASSIDTVQGKVQTENGSLMYFKPCTYIREPEFLREVGIMARLEELGLATQIRVPELQGIVVSGEKAETTIGILITWIDSSEAGTHLRSPGLWRLPEIHKKWEEQITATVHQLHAHDIVWGDVHPMNILIDRELNAWAIDFGGMNNVEFVDEDKRETVEGDWQGVKRTFKEWLPSRVHD